jgi:hypothetical protein
MSLVQTCIVVVNFDVILSLISSQKVATICFSWRSYFLVFPTFGFWGKSILFMMAMLAMFLDTSTNTTDSSCYVVGWSLRSNSAGEKCRIVSETQHD